MPTSPPNKTLQYLYLLAIAVLVCVAMLALLMLANPQDTTTPALQTKKITNQNATNIDGNVKTELENTANELEQLLADNPVEAGNSPKVQALIEQADAAIAAIEKQAANSQLNTQIPPDRVATDQTRELSQKLNELNTTAP